jgi:glycosyltransferase involved in cell wall biosynthesis
MFVAQGWKAKALRKIVIFAYRSTFLAKNTVGIFQNPDDLKLFVGTGIIKSEKALLTLGAGVDTSRFIYLPEPVGSSTVILVSRMLWDKGIGEFVKAAEMLKKDGVNCHMVLVGKPDPENPTSISEETLRNWDSKGVVEWWGYREDMPKVFAQSNIVVLPTTYGEGVPKVLIEAASCGRAIVATDVPGCREIVRDNENGLLIPPHDPKSLASALKTLIGNAALRAKMGRYGRKIVETEFSEEIVVRQTMAVYEKLLSEKSPC